LVFSKVCQDRCAKMRGNLASPPSLNREQRVVNMMPDDRKSAYRNQLLVASAMVAVGLIVSGLSMAELKATNPQTAQATQPLQPSPPATDDKAPAESKPGGDRPTTPAPEPARPDADAQKAGAPTALPPAPAEKTAAPIKEK
jgi:hypothetical protein